MAGRKIWNFRKLNFKTQKELEKKLNISSTLAMLLVNRGYLHWGEAQEFLEPSLTSLVSPFELNNMLKAVEKISLAIKEQQKIVIYGDYDVDGITGTALLTDVFRFLGVQVDYYIPNRVEEGYGLNIETLNALAQSGAQLIITVDCGISSRNEIAWGKSIGLDFIITDHHQPPQELPQCLIINPQLETKDVSWKDLSGVGVALKLAQGLLKTFNKTNSLEILLNFMDLAALGTIADIVPLVGENRIIVKYGIEQIAAGKRIGLRALCDNVNLDFRNINSTNIGYLLAPRLNACGRIGDARLGVKLLLTTCENEAQEIAQVLDLENQKRQSIESKILNEALDMLQGFDFTKNKIIVLKGEDWHQGVIGIVASRLVERYYRPVIILTKFNDTYKGSGRSIPGFHLYQALNVCEDLLESYGGHSQAAGLSLKEDKVEQFTQEINAYASKILTEKDFVPILDLDGEINLENANFNMLDEIKKMEPFGCANPEPVLVYRRGEVQDYKEVGSSGGHLKLKVKAGNSLLDAIGFNMADRLELAATREPLDLAFSLDKNHWNGKTSLQMVLKDIKSYTQSDNPYLKPDFLDSLFLDGPKYLQDNYINAHEYLENNSEQNYIKPHFQENLDYIDVRGYNDKIVYIKEIISANQKSIIFVNKRETAYSLAADLRRDLFFYKDKIGYYHAGLKSDTRKEIKDIFCKGKLQTIVATSAFDKNIPEIENLILYDLCFSKDEYNRIISWAGNNKEVRAKVHLLYGPKDKEKTLKVLAGIAPERDQLAKFYLLLKKLANKSNPILFTNEQLAEWANNYKIMGSQARYMERWLKVFEELGLISLESENGNRKIYFNHSCQRVSLEKSRSFLEGMDIKNKFLEYEQFAFTY